MLWSEDGLFYDQRMQKVVGTLRVAWYHEGHLHRVKGPAVYTEDGCFKWHQNGYLHRIDGPAFVTDGYKAWFVRGERHRTDGPAIERENGENGWWYKNKQYYTIGAWENARDTGR